MKYFISYRHNGAESTRLKLLQQAIRDAFTETQHTFYSTYVHKQYFDSNRLSYTDILLHALHEINGYDRLLVILDSDEKSEGMLIEVGYCLAKSIPIIVVKNRRVKSHQFPAIADQVVQYDGLTDLRKNIHSLLLINNTLP